MPLLMKKKKVAREIKREMENDVIFDVSQGVWLKSDKKKKALIHRLKFHH